MAPNIQAETSKPICVSDSFHFSSFYWRESNASLAGLNSSNGNDSSDSDDMKTSRKERGISIDSSEAGSVMMGEGESAVFRVRCCYSSLLSCCAHDIIVSSSIRF